jgi:CubicO group peptidase (beta-lactamase class C family)
MWPDSKDFYSPLKTKEQILNDIGGFESFVTAQMQENGVLGLSVAIISDNQTIYARGFGYKDYGKNTLVDENTIFEAASLGKPVTAYLALILVEKGKLLLDKPLNQYTKTSYIPDKKYADKITLRMVLNHTTGMVNDPDGLDRSVKFEPGTRFSYSGGGFRYLQYVLEDITGTPFDVLVANEVLKPLKMSRSSYKYKVEFEENLAHGTLAPRQLDVNAAYSLLSTPSDIALFLKELLNPTLLSKTTVEEMTTASIKVNKDVSWGLGIGIQHTDQGDSIWQWGNNADVFNSFFVAFKASHSGVIIMTNNQSGKNILKSVAHKAIGGNQLSYMGTVK